MTTDPVSPAPEPEDPTPRLTQLIARGLYPHGIPYATDLLATPDGCALVDYLSPPRPGIHPTDRATQAHRTIVAAVTALGGPTAHALEALLDLHPAIRGRRAVALTRTERREKAGVAFRVGASTVQRHTEDRLAERLAVELYQRVRVGIDTTHATDQHRQPPALPPTITLRPTTAEHRRSAPDRPRRDPPPRPTR